MKRTVRWPWVVVCLSVGVVLGRWLWQPSVQGQLPATTSIPRELTSYRDIVKQVLPSVVSLESKVKNRGPRRARPRADMPEMPDDFRRFFDEMQRRQDDGVPEQNIGFGSGFIVDASGVILTNHHVVEGADQVEVTLTDGRKFTATDIKFDRNTDLAIVRIKAEGNLPILTFGDSDQMDIGDRVLAVGAPFGLTGSVTHGIISAKGRDLKLNRYDDFLQTDAAINPGNSGGPLVNLAGQVIGVNSVIKSRSGGFQGVGMAISGNLARSIAMQLQKQGVVKRGYLGIEMVADLTPEVASRLGLKDGQGVIVARVVENSPAAKAGLQADDVILKINGQAVKDNRGLIRVVGTLPIGQAVDVEILRDQKPTKLRLTLEQEPDNYGQRRVIPRNQRIEGGTVNVAKFGLDLIDLPADRAEAFGLKEGGALIVRVDPNSAAAAGGIARGLVIAKVNRKDVASAEAARDALEKASPAQGVLLHLKSADGATTIVLLKEGE